MGRPANPVDAPKVKRYQCLFVLYPESQQAAIEYVQANFPCAWALHDKDTYTQGDFEKYISKHEGQAPEWKPGDLKKPHIHFVCKFPNQRYFTAIAKEISKGSGLDIPVNVIRRCDYLYKAYVYLWHKNDLEKYQYDNSIVGMNNFEVPSEREGGMGQEEDNQISVLLDMPPFGTFNEMARWAYENGCWASFRKNYGLWRDIFIEQRRMNPGLTPYVGAPGEPVERLDKEYGTGFLPLSPKGVEW